jgi:hypothetical protein
MGRRRGRGGGQGNKGRKSKGRKSKSRSKGGASTGRRGGQGNRSKGFGRANSQSKSKSTGGASTGRRGGQGNRNTKPGRAKGTVSGKSIRKAVGRVAKHTNPGLRGLRSVAGAIGGAAKAATAPKKKQSKLQKQFSNFKTRWKAMSTPEAKKQRRRDRLRNQFGLDYDRMNKSFAVDVNVDRAMKHYKVPNFIRNITPGFIKNYKLKKQFYSPTKLGARDGWYRGKYNSTGKSIRSATPAVGNTM